MPTRQDWLLRFIRGTDGSAWVDRIRIMKGMFLFQQERLAPRSIDYSFRPYDYGPFTPQVYRDLDELKARGFISTAEDAYAPGRERYYRVTDHGRTYLATVNFPEESERDLLDVYTEVMSLDFRDLLRRVYRAHPASAERSVARSLIDD